MTMMLLLLLLLRLGRKFGPHHDRVLMLADLELRRQRGPSVSRPPDVRLRRRRRRRHSDIEVAWRRLARGAAPERGRGVVGKKVMLLLVAVDDGAAMHHLWLSPYR